MRRTLAAAGLVVVCLACVAGLGAAAHEEPDRTVLGIELAPDGDAAVHHVTAYDLNDSDERATYEAIAGNESQQATNRSAALEELESAAADGRNRTDLEMRIHNGSIRVFEQDGYGRVAVRAEWANLAYYNETRVVVTEPFRGGYESSLEFVSIHGPDGYRRGPASPNPGRARANSATWNPETSNFSSFYVGFEEAASGGSDGSGGDGGDSGDGGDVGGSNGDGGGDTGGGDSGGGDAGEGGDEPSGDLVVFLRALLIALVPVAAVLLAVRRRR